MGSSVRTNFPADGVKGLIDIASKVTDAKTFKKVLGPPYAFHPPDNTTGGIYTLRLDMNKIAALSVLLFGADSRYAEAANGAGAGAQSSPAVH
jgi:hypothetical protein